MTAFTEKIVIGAAWPYVHAIPHMGNLLCQLAADTFARFYKLTGRKVVLVSGSDQHGARMEFEAMQKDSSPKELVDQNHQKVVQYLDYFKINYERLGRYSRTESEEHKEFVKTLYKKIYDNGYIITQKDKLPYCPNCNMFLPDRFVEGTCPHCGYEHAQGNQCENCLEILDPIDLKDPHCAVCGNKPDFKYTKHWYLDLPQLSEQLKSYVEKQDQWSAKVKNLTKNWIDHLEARPITRDVSFGIEAPFPDAEGKTIYVWAEAVLGYLSATKEWAENTEYTFEEFWKDPETKLLFTLGKDNIPFHSVILPAILIASGEDYILPHQIYANEYLNFGGKQFSKSKRVGIWLDEAIKLFDNPDYWRYYLFSIFPEQKDTDFKWKELETRINDELISNFANFVYRALSFLYKNFDGKVPEFDELGAREKALKRKTKEIVKETRKLLESYELRKGLKKVIELAIEGNKYLTQQEPWNTIDSEPNKCFRTLYSATNLCKILAILIEPYLPVTAKEIWTQLNLENSVHEVRWENATEFSIEPGHQINEPQLLFEKVDHEELQEKLAKMRKTKES